jgi:hypothetical protein
MPHANIADSSPDANAAFSLKEPFLRLNAGQVRWLSVDIILAVLLAFLISNEASSLDMPVGTISDSTAGLRVEVGLRTKDGGGGVVLQLMNSTQYELKNVVIEMGDPVSRKAIKSRLEEWAPGEVVEFGGSGGLKIMRGAVLRVSTEDHGKAGMILK